MSHSFFFTSFLLICEYPQFRFVLFSCAPVMCRTGTLSLQARKKKKKTWTPVSLCVRRWRRRKARETKQTKKQKAKTFEKEMFRNLAHIDFLFEPASAFLPNGNQSNRKNNRSTEVKKKEKDNQGAQCSIYIEHDVRAGSHFVSI